MFVFMRRFAILIVVLFAGCVQNSVEQPVTTPKNWVMPSIRVYNNLRNINSVETALMEEFQQSINLQTDLKLLAGPARMTTDKTVYYSLVDQVIYEENKQTNILEELKRVRAERKQILNVNPSAYCECCKNATSALVCEYDEKYPMDARQCFARHVNGRWEKGCAYGKSLPEYNYIADEVIKRQ